jgi:hypothetical protein
MRTRRGSTDKSALFCETKRNSIIEPPKARGGEESFRQCEVPQSMLPSIVAMIESIEVLAVGANKSVGANERMFCAK